MFSDISTENMAIGILLAFSGIMIRAIYVLWNRYTSLVEKTMPELTMAMKELSTAVKAQMQ